MDSQGGGILEFDAVCLEEDKEVGMVPDFMDKVPACAEALKDGGEFILCLCMVTVTSGDIDTNGGGRGTGARGHVMWIGSLPVGGGVYATDGMHDAGNGVGEASSMEMRGRRRSWR